MKRVPELFSLKNKGFGYPSFFDAVVVLFIIGFPFIGKLVPLDNNMATSLYLVIGSLTLWVISLSLKQRRTISVTPLALLTLWVLVNAFLKSWRKDPGTAEWYINWSMMNEGCMYFIAAAALITTIIKYAKSYGWYYLAVIGVITGWFLQFVLPMRSNSPLMALFMPIPIMLIKARERLLAGFSLALIGLVAWFRWDWLIYKFRMRPVMWGKFGSQLTFTGNGFPHDIKSVTGWYWSGRHDGYCFMHNDPLEFAMSQGVIGLVLLGWFMVTVLYKTKMSLAWYLCMSAAFLCMFQRTMFFPIQAGIILIVIALTILENGAAKSFSAEN